MVAIKSKLKSTVFRNLALLALLSPLIFASYANSPSNINITSLKKSLSIPHVIDKTALEVVSSPLPVIGPSPKISPLISPSVESATSDSKVAVSEDSQPTPPATSVSSESRDQTRGGGDINMEVNAYRQNNGKTPLTIADVICDLANRRISEIRINFSHQNWSEPLHALGYSAGAENIAMGSRGAGYVVNQQWAKSLGHKANMLGDYPNGCGVYDGKFALFLFAR